MKKIVLIIVLISNYTSSFSQIIFPDDINYLVTDENLSGNEILKFNEFFLSNLDFKKVNDTLYSNNKTKETIALTSFRQLNKIHSTINYFAVGNHWSDFEKGLKDFNITNLTANTFIAEYKDYKDYKIELLEDTLVQNNEQKHLRFSFAYEKKVKPDRPEKPFFPIKREYPFRYSIWYFDVQLKSEEKDIYYPAITLTKEKGKNKIEFLDRKNILIYYTDKNNILQKAKGTYTSSEYGVAGTGIYSQINGPSIHFELENSSVILDKLYLRETVDLSKLSTKDFLEFIFNMDFNIVKSGIGFILQSKIELNRHTFDIKRE